MIKISVPNDDHVALRAMAKALEEIALARGAPAQSKQIGELNYKINIDTAGADTALKQLVKQVEVDTTSQQVESLAIPVEANGATYETDLGSENPQPVPVADSTGTPWDERIHSTSKALNSDGTWRLRRKPKDMNEAEWESYIEEIKQELKWDSRHLGASEEYVKVTGEETVLEIHQTINEPDTTPPGDDFHTDAGVVTEQQVASFPPPPPVPSVDIGIYQGATNGIGANPTAMTFPQVMAFLTERHGRITSAQVDQIIADMGLEKITDLNTQPEHTGPFIARVKALLGE